MHYSPDEPSERLVYIHSVREPLAEALRFLSGNQASVSYYISDYPCNKAQAHNEFIEISMGLANVQYGAHYSELTGYLWTDEFVKIGGHDLIKIIRGMEGKWIILEIDYILRGKVHYIPHKQIEYNEPKVMP